MTAGIVRRASVAGAVVGVAGLVAFVSGIFSSFWIGPRWFETIGDLALVVEFGAVPILMLAFWELGGLTPTPLARLALAGGWIAAATWCAVQVLHLTGVAEFDYRRPGLDADGIQTMAVFVIGLWIAGANLLAGRWLGIGRRILGIVTGLGMSWALAHIDSWEVHVDLAAFAYFVLLPIWALLMALHLARIAREREATNAIGQT
jgi:hypothetical protein